MKKVFLFLLTFVAMVAEAQTKGNFEVLDLGSFKLHVPKIRNYHPIHD